jgi:putative ABC transport system permease protein
MTKEPYILMKRRFTGRLLESGLLILAVGLGVGAAASGLSLLMHTSSYSRELLSSATYRELVVTTKDKAEDMETPVVVKGNGTDVILTISDLSAAELVPQVSYAYISNSSRMRFLNQETLSRMSEGGGPGEAPPQDGNNQDNSSDRNNRLEEMQTAIKEASENPDIIIPEIEEISGRDITPQYFDARNLRAEFGSLFTENDMKSMTGFIVLGYNTAKLLLEENQQLVSLIGKKILSINSYYTIVGILEETGTLADELFFTPDKSEAGGGFQRFRPDSNRQLRFSVSDPSELDQASMLLTNWFEKTYGEGEFVISNPREEAERLMDRNRGISYLILFLSLAGLFIASVNISHILMSRTLRMKKYVGILKALGAAKNDIFKLFGTEALVVTLAGALLGSVIAFPLSNAMERAMGLDQSARVYIMMGIVLSSLLTLAFSIVPSFQNSGFEAAEAMKTAG